MPRTRTRPMSTSKKATPYQPPTQPHRTTQREDAGPSSLPTGHVEAPHYPETTGIKWPYDRVIGKRVVGNKVEYLLTHQPTWVSEDLIRPGERSLEEDFAEGPGDPPSTLPNNSLSSSSNVYGGRDSLIRCFHLLYSFRKCCNKPCKHAHFEH
ncbi:hypothetical protein WR25_26043 [Diploscapter pachys]|uniref:Chromo domain-containing protein n=1 Tax=Diploscapter pachys TaxID=2018661 RepID=A0A2A2K574_9BILA|nr:hypothetical protein WR25_26043 [Diploscapter pachys]